MIPVKIKKLDPQATVPTYAHDGDAGMDMRACLDVPYIMLRGHETRRIPTAIAMEIPPGYFGSARERSGLAAKGLRLGGGVIDSGYRGEIQGILTNTTPYDISINHGDKIFQIILQPYARGAMLEVEEFESETSRGAAGFGSTGV